MKRLIWIFVFLFARTTYGESLVMKCDMLAGKRVGQEFKYERMFPTSFNVETDSIAWGKSEENGTTNPLCLGSHGQRPGYDLSACRDDRGKLYFIAQLNDFSGLNIQQYFDSNKRGAKSRIVITSAHPSNAEGAMVYAYSECSVE
jgi:hypothetical protein